MKINATIKPDLANRTKIFRFPLQFPSRTLSDKELLTGKCCNKFPSDVQRLVLLSPPTTRVGAAHYPRQETVLSATTLVLRPGLGLACSWHTSMPCLFIPPSSCILPVPSTLWLWLFHRHPLPCFPLLPLLEFRLVLHTSLIFNTSFHRTAVDGGRAERPRRTHRYLLPHAGLGEVWFHPAANLPYDRLRRLTLVRPLTCVQFVPNGAEKRDWAWVSKNH